MNFENCARERIAGYIRSFIALGLDLPAQLINAMGNEGTAEFRFDEIAYAVSPKRLEQSWKNFKEQIEWSEEFVGITLGENAFRLGQSDIDAASDNGSYVRNLPNPVPLALYTTSEGVTPK
jgi:hypothetical protein